MHPARIAQAVVLVLLVGLFAAGPAAAEPMPPPPPAVRFAGPAAGGPNLDLGIELGELLQNRFRDLGPKNYTFLTGQQLWFRGLDRFGWRVVSIQVDLSNEHLRDERRVCCISGNRDNLEGWLRVHRLYADLHVGSLDLGYLPSLEAYAVSLRPVFSLGVGYNRWVTTDTAAGATHDVYGLGLGGAVRLRALLFRWVFVELPVIDAFYLTATNRSPAGQVGEAHLDRPENFAMFSWLNAGVRLAW